MCQELFVCYISNSIGASCDGASLGMVLALICGISLSNNHAQ